MSLSKFLLSLMTASLLLPSLALAHEGESESPTPTPTRSPKIERAAFCSRFGDATGNVSKDTAANFNKLQDGFAKRKDKVKTDFAATQSKLQDQRRKADDQLKAHLAKLDAKSTTTAQKAAVAVFKAAVQSALAQLKTALKTAP